MFDFFKSTRTGRGPAPEPPASQPRATPSDAAARGAEPPIPYRELIRIVVRDTLRKQGIPSGWISSQISSRAPGGQTRGSHQIQLTVQKWNEALMRFAPLLQQQILQTLQQYEPQHHEPQHQADAVSVVWAYAPDCGYPYTTLPEPSYWSQAGRKFDLPETARRFHEVDDDFATTVPSPLR